MTTVLRMPDAEGNVPAGTDMWIAILSVGDVLDAANYPALVGAVADSPPTLVTVVYLKHLVETGTITAEDREAIIEEEDGYWIYLHGPYRAPADAYAMSPDEAGALVQQIQERQRAEPDWSVELDQVLAGRRRPPKKQAVESAGPRTTHPFTNPRRDELKRRLMR